MICENCGNNSFRGDACMQCGHSAIRVGPVPETEIRRPTQEELIQKRQRARGRKLSPEEAAKARKELGID